MRVRMGKCEVDDEGVMGRVRNFEGGDGKGLE
jgi:hypothetical protein